MSGDLESLSSLNQRWFEDATWTLACDTGSSWVISFFKMQAWDTHPVQPWPHLPSAQSLAGCPRSAIEACVLLVTSPLVPTAPYCLHPTLGDIAVPSSIHVLSHPVLSATWFNHTCPSGCHLNAKCHLLQGAFQAPPRSLCHTTSTCIPLLASLSPGKQNSAVDKLCV